MKGTKPAQLTPGNLPADSIPRAPSFFSKEAQAEWRRIMPDLIKRRVLDNADMGSVENYCIAIGRVRQFERIIQASGDRFDPKLFRMQDKAMMTARQLAAELGLTPVSRSRPSIRSEEDGDDDSPLDL